MREKKLKVRSLWPLAFSVLCFSPPGPLPAQVKPHLDDGDFWMETPEIAVSPDGQSLIFVQYYPGTPKPGDHRIMHFDMTRLELREIAADPEAYTSVRFLDDNRFVYLSETGTTLMDRSGKVHARAPGGGYYPGACNGMVFVDGADSNTLVMDPAFKFLRKLTATPKPKDARTNLRDVHCTEQEILVVFSGGATIFDAKTFAPRCTMRQPSNAASYDVYDGGFLLGGDRALLMDRHSGIHFYKNCVETTSARGASAGSAMFGSEVVLGLAGSERMHGGTNTGPHTHDIGLLFFDFSGRRLRDRDYFSGIRQIRALPGRPNRLVIAHWAGPLTFLDVKTGARLELTVTENRRWLLEADDGEYNASPDAGKFLYFTNGARFVPGSEPSKRNLFQRFLNN